MVYSIFAKSKKRRLWRECAIASHRLPISFSHINYFVSLVTFSYMYEQNVSCPKILVSYISYFDDINKIGLAIEQTDISRNAKSSL